MPISASIARISFEVTMRVADAVRAEVLGHLAEQQVRPRAEPRARHAARRAHADRRARRDETLLEQRASRPSRIGGRVTAGIRDELGAANLLAPRLRESVRHGARRRSRCRRSAERSTTCAPAARARSTHTFDAPCGIALNTSCALAERRIVGRDERDMSAAGQLGARSTLLVGGREGEREPRVALNQRAQLASGISTGPEHADRDSMH